MSRREERRFGMRFQGRKVAVFEFDREALDDLQYAFGPNDAFRHDVIEAMRWMDEAVDEPEVPGIAMVVRERRHGE